MKKYLIIATTYIIFFVHIVTTIIVLFGSFFPGTRIIYQIVLVLTFCSWLLYKGCILTIWEYKLRKKINPKIEIYEFGFVDYYLRKFFKGKARPTFIHNIGLFFIVTSMVISFLGHGLVIYK